MDDTAPQPTTDSDVVPAPANAGLTPAAPAKVQGDDLASQAPTATSPAGDETGHAASTTEAIKAGAQKLTGQASEHVRSFADQGKERVTGAIDELAQMLTDAAGQVDGKLGGHYGDYARQAAGHVSGFAEQIRGKDVEELVDDVRVAVRKSPGVAIGVSAAIGFVIARLVSSGLEQRDAA